jgi:hypothetical protein
MFGAVRCVEQRRRLLNPRTGLDLARLAHREVRAGVIRRGVARVRPGAIRRGVAQVRPGAIQRSESAER